jgi:hypothetical protein
MNPQKSTVKLCHYFVCHRLEISLPYTEFVEDEFQPVVPSRSLGVSHALDVSDSRNAN